MQIITNGDTRPIPFLIVQSSDHITGLTGATPTVTISKNGATFASPSGAVTEIGNGWYKLTPSGTDTTTNGMLLVHATATSGDPSDVRCQVVAVDVYNATSFGLSDLDAAISSRLAASGVPTNFSSLSIDGSGRIDVGKWLGTAVTSATAGVPDVNAARINSVAATAVTTINANVGTAQPTNFTGTGASALVQIDVRDWLGTAVTAATAGIPDVNTKNINNVAAATPGASGGLLIAGSNAVTTFASLTSTGTFTISDGLVISRSTTNASAVTITGNGTGHGISIVSGSGATGDAIHAVAASTNGSGVSAAGNGTGAGASFQSGAGAGANGILAQSNAASGAGNGIAAQGAVAGDGVAATGGATGRGIHATGGSTSGAGIRAEANVSAVSANGFEITATGTGNAINLAPGGTGTGISGSMVGNITGTITTATNVTNPVGIDWSRVSNPTTAVNLSGTTISTSQQVASVSGSVGSVAGNVAGDVSGHSGLDWSRISNPATTVDLSNTTIKTLDTAPPGIPSTSSIATAVWQDATAGDFTAAGSIGKSLFTGGIVPGGSGGFLISGANSGTVTIGDGLVIDRTTLNGDAIKLNPNGTGYGINGSLSGPLAVNGDKTGYALTSAEHTAISGDVWDATRAAHATTGTFGQGIASVQGPVDSVVNSVTVTGSVTVGGYAAGQDPLTLLNGNLTLSTAAYLAGADALLDRANAIETGITPRLAIRYSASALAGVLSGAPGPTVVISAIDNPATPRITATVDDFGNRTTVVLT